MRLTKKELSRAGQLLDALNNQKGLVGRVAHMHYLPAMRPKRTKTKKP